MILSWFSQSTSVAKSVRQWVLQSPTLIIDTTWRAVLVTTSGLDFLIVQGRGLVDGPDELPTAYT